MKQYLKEVLDNLFSLPLGIVIVFLAFYVAVYYDFLEKAFFIALGIGIVWFLLRNLPKGK